MRVDLQTVHGQHELAGAAGSTRRDTAGALALAQTKLLGSDVVVLAGP